MNIEYTYEKQLSMKAKVALVTGASSGLGRHFSHVLAAAGAKVIVTARRKEALDQVVQEIVNSGGEALAISMDVNDPAAIKAAFDTAENAFGPVTTLVNNAGAGGAKRFLDIDEAFWDFTMDTNVKSIWRISSEFARRAKNAKTGGSIVNISSMYGLQVARGNATYCTSKSAVLTLTQTMALDLARFGIRTNAICPGHFPSEMTNEFLSSDIGVQVLDRTPLKRAGDLQELNVPLLMLASDAGSYINGVSIPVDGGTSLQGL